eukprot:539215_1
MRKTLKISTCYYQNYSCQLNHQHRFTSHETFRIKCINRFANQQAAEHIKKMNANRQCMSICPRRKHLEGSQAYAQYRKKIFKSKTIRQIEQILRSRDDFDVTVYTAAIQKSGYLRDIDFCTDI